MIAGANEHDALPPISSRTFREETKGSDYSHNHASFVGNVDKAAYLSASVIV